jgi:peptide chain release factor 1
MIKKKLEEMKRRYNEVQTELQNPDLVKDNKKYKEVMQEYSSLGEIVDTYNIFLKVEEELENAKVMAEESEDSEMRALAKEELYSLEEKHSSIYDKLKIMIVPKDPLDKKNIIMEIRAGTGGEEAALFAADLYRIYTRYAENKKWKIEILSSNETGIGGFKEIIFSIMGSSVYADLRYEMGVHRVQRVPVTETGGRVHTSAVTVAVLPEAEETDIDIKNEDLRIDVFRSSGPGGQSVNTTDSAVRITYIPTGMVVTCQDEKSQHKNKAKALRVLRSRLYEEAEKKRQSERADARRKQVGSGDRSERIRTYNFPQNRVTDHRINLTLYKLDSILQGDIAEIIDALKLNSNEEYLKTV